MWILLPEYSEGLELIPALIGKCFITCAFAIIYVFTSELFPTSVRGTVIGLCSMWARIGGMLAPFSSELVCGALLCISFQPEECFHISVIYATVLPLLISYTHMRRQYSPCTENR